MTVRKSRMFVTIRNVIDQFLGETILLRDREANILSIAAIGDARVAQSSNLFRWVINDAAAPHLAVQRVEFNSEIGWHCRRKSGSASH